MRKERNDSIFCENLTERDRLEGLGLDGNIILKGI
jgi:hypothetical protein